MSAAKFTRGEKLWIAGLAVLAVALIVLCVLISGLSPRQKELFKESTELNAQLKAAQKQNEELSARLTELQNVDADTEAVRAEAFDYLAQLEGLIQEGKTDYRLCYLTFDDGPYAMTPKYIKKLDKYHVQATFFTTSVNGKHCYDDPSVETAPIYDLYVKYGHTIANHTYTHGIFTGIYSSADTFLKAVDDQENYVQKLTGVKTQICRFPGGMNSAGSLYEPICEGLRARGYAWVDWTANDGDGANIHDRDKARKNFKKSFGDDPIEVVLLHDYNDSSYDLLPEFIEMAREKNYILAPLFPGSVALKR